MRNFDRIVVSLVLYKWVWVSHNNRIDIRGVIGKNKKEKYLPDIPLKW